MTSSNVLSQHKSVKVFNVDGTGSPSIKSSGFGKHDKYLLKHEVEREFKFFVTFQVE